MVPDVWVFLPDESAIFGDILLHRKHIGSFQCLYSDTLTDSFQKLYIISVSVHFCETFTQKMIGQFKLQTSSDLHDYIHEQLNKHKFAWKIL